MHFNPNGGGDVDCTHTFFKQLFLHEKRGLEAQNFFNLPDSFKLTENQKIEGFHSVFG